MKFQRRSRFKNCNNRLSIRRRTTINESKFGDLKKTLDGEGKFKLQPNTVHDLEELLKEYKDVFTWMYKDLKGIPP
jgi:hypothetical protein